MNINHSSLVILEMNSLMERRVCVTGGDGFLGSTLVKTLLSKGYSVNATVQDLLKAQFLKSLPFADKQLSLFQADLWDDESFDSAIEGCSGVFHLAAPVIFASENPQRDIIECAVRGTLNVLRSCEKAKSVKRVIHTSSVGAARFAREFDGVVHESLWTCVELVKQEKPIHWAYTVSKTEAERAAFEFGMEKGLEVVSILPVLICGEWLTPYVPLSISMIANSLFDSNLKSGPSGFVHVEDVSKAQIMLMETSAAHGRYLCCSHSITHPRLVRFLSHKYPQFGFPSIEEEDDKEKENTGVTVSVERLKELGFQYGYNLSDMFDETLRQCDKAGLLVPSTKTP